MTREPVTIWAVYHDPLDFPGKFVARAYDDAEPRLDHLEADTLDELHKKLPPGLVRMPPAVGDDPVIVETWV
jgi:hypothetical protein